jgi:hypothetical protein
MRYFFHIKDGLTVTLDNEGQELVGLDAVKNETAGVAADLLKGPLSKIFASNGSWRLWVTDEPDGAGKTIVSLTLSAGT